MPVTCPIYASDDVVRRGLETPPAVAVRVPL